VKGAAVSKQGRLLHATTDGRLLCSPISSIPAVRQLPAGKSGLAKRSSPGLPTGEEGGSEKPWKQRLRVKSAWGEEALNLHFAT
jgi:hypothetical protein